MSKIAVAALKLAVKTLTEQYGWKDAKPAAPNTRRTKTMMQLPSGARIELAVKQDKLVALCISGGSSLHECCIGDPQYDHKMSELEVVVATDAGFAYGYALVVLKGPFPAGEAAIATDAGAAYYYAHDVLELSDKEAKEWGDKYIAQSKRSQVKRSGEARCLKKP